MPVIEVNGKSVELDEDGFIVNLEEQIGRAHV